MSLLTRWTCALLVPYVRRRIRRRLGVERSFADWTKFIRTYHRSLPFPRAVRRHYRCRLAQIDSEFVALLELVAGLRPRRIVEIGTSQGGSLFLLARAAAPDAKLVSIDLPHDPHHRPRWRDRLYRSFASEGQSIELIHMSSREPGCLARVRALLAGEQADVLFIDGDHSYEGVRADYETFAPLVRSGGVIVFHDVQPDYGTRFGPELATKRDSGDVHKLWAELKPLHPEALQIIESEEQDGYGLGVIFLTSSVASGDDL